MTPARRCDWHPDMPEEYRNQIVTGDARELAKRIPDESIDLVFTDPPYGTQTYKNDTNVSDDTWQELRRIGHNLYALWGFPVNHFNWARHFSDLSLIGYIVVHHYNEPLVSQGLTRIHQDIAIWGKSVKQIAADDVREPYSEDASLTRWWLGGERYTKNELRNRLAQNTKNRIGKDRPTGRRCTDLWRIPAPGHGFNSHLRKHKNEKPMEAAKRILLLLTKPGDIVLDPFTGSGTIPAACKELDRLYIGFEISDATSQDARNRLWDTQKPLIV